MSSSVFLDSNGWIALLNATEQLHERANEVWIDLGLHGYRIVLSDWIIAETGNGLSRSNARTRFAESVDDIWRSSTIDLVFMDHSLIAKTVDLYRGYEDKSWGLVDCASFVVMRERGISDAFTSDYHFEQAGFRRLLST